MIIEYIFGFLSGIAIGFFIGLKIQSNKEIRRLRSRGYTIEFVRRYYDTAGWRFVFNGFTENGKTVTKEGKFQNTKADAIANANAHYNAIVLKIGCVVEQSVKGR